MDEIINKYELEDVNIITNNINTTFSAYSKKFNKKVFVKIFGEEDKFINENKFVKKLSTYSGYLDSDEQIKCIILEYRDYKDVVLNKENIKKIAETLAKFHKLNVFNKEESKKLTAKINDSYKLVISNFKEEKIKKIYKLISPYFPLIDFEEQNKPKVMLHGDFGIRNIKEYLGKIYFIDFERTSFGNFWTDLDKFFSRDLTDLNDKKYFLNIYMKNMPGLPLPSSLYYHVQLFYSALGIYKYNLKVNDKEFLNLGQTMLEKVEKYLESNQVFNSLLGLCLGDAMGIACQYYTPDEIKNVYNGKVETIVQRKMKQDDSSEHQKGVITEESMQCISLLISYNMIKQFDNEQPSVKFDDLDNKDIKPNSVFESLIILNNASWQGIGNDGIMRGISLGIIAFLENWDANKLMNNITSSIPQTNNTYEAQGGAICIAELVLSLLQKNDFNIAYEQALKMLDIYEKEQNNFSLSNNIKKINEIGIEKFINDIQIKEELGSEVLESLPLILFILKKGLRLKDALINSINYGGDSISIGAVIGAISAIIYGIDDMEKEISIIMKRNERFIYNILLIVDNIANRCNLIYE